MSRRANVLVRSEQMDLGVGEHDADFAYVFDGEFGFAVGAGDAADGARQMVAFEFFNVGDFEGFEEEVVETNQSQSVGDVEAQDERANEVGRLLEGTNGFGFIAGFDFHVSRLQVKSDLKFQMLHDRRVNLLPVLFQRRIPIVGNWNFSEAILCIV